MLFDFSYVQSLKQRKLLADQDLAHPISFVQPSNEVVETDMILMHDPMTTVESIRTKGLLTGINNNWYEHDLQPIMGTSLIVEVELSDSEESENDQTDDDDKRKTDVTPKRVVRCGDIAEDHIDHNRTNSPKVISSSVGDKRPLLTLPPK